MTSHSSQPRGAWRFPVRGTLAASVLTLAFLPVTEAASPQIGGQRQNPRAAATPGSNRTNLAVGGGGNTLSGGGTSAGAAAGQNWAAPGGEVVTLSAPLSDIEVPLPSDLFTEYVKDRDAAVRLGKAFFWDIQTGSDGLVACATCHNFGGVDKRVTNQSSSGGPGVLERTFKDLEFGASGPNGVVTSGDFPFHLKADLNDGEAYVDRDSDDIFGSAGVAKRDFVSSSPGVDVEEGTCVEDLEFNVGGLNVDQTAPRNAPTVINAIFNVRSFWDGRADWIFNGVDNWGDRNPDARVYRRNDDGIVEEVQVSIEKAALASQAVGPALSDFEMSWHGKNFEDLAKKMLGMQALANQDVHEDDYHLGEYSARPALGLIDPANGNPLKYAKMINQAFYSKWTQGDDSIATWQVRRKNFALYWGLAIMLYEAELISDDAPYDRFVAGDESALTEQEQRGMNRWFSGGAGCAGCHAGSEFAGATWSQLAEDQNGAGVERMGNINSGQEGAVGFTTLPYPSGSKVCNGVTIWTLDADPRGQLLEIIRPDTGEVIAFGNIPGQGGCNPEEEFEAVLMPGPGFPTGPIDLHEFDPPAEFGLHVVSTGETLPGTSTCIIEMEVHAHVVADAGTPAGDYPVKIGGQHVADLVFGENGPNGIYDVGFYNIGIRPTAEDLGIGAVGPFGPLSLSQRIRDKNPLDVKTFELFDLSLEDNFEPPVDDEEYLAVMGAFRASSVRNISLSGPYMHNGGMATLEQVVQFYARGADFIETNIPDLHPDVAGVGALRNSPEEQAALVAFMANGLLDQRVARRAGPFSHPSLPYKEGAVGDNVSVNEGTTVGEAEPHTDVMIATGVDGVDFESDEHSQEFSNLLEGDIVSTLSDTAECIEDRPDSLLVMEEDGLIGCATLGVNTDSTRVVRVFLGRKPTADVTIPVSVSEGAIVAVESRWDADEEEDEGEGEGEEEGEDEGAGDPELDVEPGAETSAEIVFTTANWFHPQEVEITALGNDIVGDEGQISVTFGASVSDDADFNGKVVPGETFLVKDTTSDVDKIHVDVNASNEFIDGTPDYPFHSITDAFVCGGNNTIKLAAGDYHEDVHIQGFSVVIEGEEGVVLHGTGNGPVVTVFGHEAAGTQLIGLELTGGNGIGGGVFVSDSSSAVLTDCVITGNSGDLGGGVACRNSSSAELVNCVVTGNTAANGAGGLHLEGGSGSVSGSLISGNTGRRGGAIFARNGATVEVLESSLLDNQADDGGAIALEGGGLVLNLSKVVGNTATQNGGGIYAMNSASVELYATKVTNNDAQTGGGIYADGGLLSLVRSTVATNGQALYLQNSVTLALNSSIVWAEGDGMAIGRNSSNPLAATVDYSIVDYADFEEGVDLGSDPLFVDAEGGDHSVESGSPAIDAGDPTLEEDPDGTRADIGSHTLLGE